MQAQPYDAIAADACYHHMLYRYLADRWSPPGGSDARKKLTIPLLYTPVEPAYQPAETNHQRRLFRRRRREQPSPPSSAKPEWSVQMITIGAGRTPGNLLLIGRAGNRKTLTQAAWGRRLLAAGAQVIVITPRGAHKGADLEFAVLAEHAYMLGKEITRFRQPEQPPQPHNTPLVIYDGHPGFFGCDTWSEERYIGWLIDCLNQIELWRRTQGDVWHLPPTIVLFGESATHQMPAELAGCMVRWPALNMHLWIAAGNPLAFLGYQTERRPEICDAYNLMLTQASFVVVTGHSWDIDRYPPAPGVAWPGGWKPWPRIDREELALLRGAEAVAIGRRVPR